MLSRYEKYIGKGRKHKQEQSELHQRHNNEVGNSNTTYSLKHNLNSNIEMIKDKTGNSSDIVIRELTMDLNRPLKAAVIYIDGLVDNKIIDEFVVETLLTDLTIQNSLLDQNLPQLIENKVIALNGIKIIAAVNELFDSLASGETIILIDGYAQALSGNTRGGEQRSIQEPQTQPVIRGPKDGFTESIQTNTSLIRRRIKSLNLWLEPMKIGEVTRTDVGIMYIKGIANDEIVEEVRQRLKRINTDSILESGYIEQLIEDQTFTTFPTLYHTERPDVVAANLLEGKIAILVDQTPFVLILPALFIQFFQSPEDYYERFDISTALRSLRVLIFLISLIAPSSYIAATTFHQEMIPTQLAFAIAAQREAAPFPAFVEALIMEVTFEILREAGIRMPRAIGTTVSIVGALVIGQAAVQAGLISPAMVIVVSITAIASFATPTIAIAISARLIRFALMVIAATFGFYGIILGLIILAIHLCSIRSFGVPYMYPFAPSALDDLGDSLFRAPLWAAKRRPKFIAQHNVDRQGEHQRPEPPKKQRNEKGERNET